MGHNENIFTPRIFFSPNAKNLNIGNDRRHSYQVQTSRESKLISKDFLKPSTKPNFLNSLDTNKKHQTFHNN